VKGCKHESQGLIWERARNSLNRLRGILNSLKDLVRVPELSLKKM
jgi:hypothetical protein